MEKKTIRRPVVLTRFSFSISIFLWERWSARSFSLNFDFISISFWSRNVQCIKGFLFLFYYFCLIFRLLSLFVFLFFFCFSGAFLFFCFYFLGTVFLIFLVFKKSSLIFEEKVNFFLFFFEIAAQIWPSCCENARPPYYAHCFKACSLTRIRCCREILYMLIRDWSKSIGWGGTHYLPEMLRLILKENSSTSVESTTS